MRKNTVFFVLLLVSMLLWSLIPIVGIYLFWGSEISFQVVSYEEFIYASVIELFFSSLVLAIYIYYSKKEKNMMEHLKFINTKDDMFINIIVNISVVIFFIIQLYMNITLELGYTVDIASQDKFITLFLPLKQLAFCILISYLIFFRPKNKLKIIVVTTSILYEIFGSILAGGRISLIILIIIPFLIYIERRSLLTRKTKLLLVTILAGFTLTSIVIVPIIGNLRATNKYLKIDTISENIYIVSDNYFELFGIELLMKLNSVQSSALLIKYDGINNNDMLSFLDPFKILIPRFIWPSKYENFYKSPIKVSAVYQGMNPETGMVGISPALGSLWANGILGLFVALFINLLFARILFYFFNSPGILAKGMGLMLLNQPVFDRIPNTFSLFIPSVIGVLFAYFIFYIILTSFSKQFSIN